MTHQDRCNASTLVLNRESPSTWNCFPDTTTAGAGTPPRLPVNTCRLEELLAPGELVIVESTAVVVFRATDEDIWVREVWVEVEGAAAVAAML